jgi:hypothetical protein
MNAYGGFAAVAHGAYDQVGASNEIAASEYAGDTGHLIFVDNYAAPFIDLDFVGIAGSENWDRIESVGDQDNIDWQTEFGARNRARFATAFRVRFAQFHSHTARFANFAGGVA